MTLSISDVNRLKQAPAVDGVLPLFHSRWSPRSFSDRSVSSADLAKVMDAARWAASSYNEQPWRYLVGTKGSDTYRKIFDSLIPFNQGWAGKAPVLILGATRTRFSQNESPNPVALYDLGAATSYLTLQAAALGLATHQMAGFNGDAARKALGIPEEFALGAVVALGYQDEPGALGNEQMIGQEIARRTRKTLGEIAFSAWGTPVDLG